jgi:PAS domain S-box-containing protein
MDDNKTSSKSKSQQVALLSASDAAKILKENRKDIFSEWEKRTREQAASARHIKEHILLDALPEVLSELIEELEAGIEIPKIFSKEKKTAVEHASQRLAVTDYTLAEVLQEYRILRDIIFEVLRTKGQIDLKTTDIILHIFDVEIRYSASRFANIQIERESAKKRQAQESEAYVNALFESSPVGIGVIDKNLRYLRINPVLAEMNGFPPEYHIGKTVDEVLPEAKDTLVPILKDILRTGIPLQNYEIHGPDKRDPFKTKYYLVNYYPVKTGSEISGVGASVLDVTLQKEIENRLAESKDRYELALRAGLIGVWEMDFNSNNIIWSERQFEIFGIDPKTKPLTYETFSKTNHPEDAPKIQNELDAAVKEKRDFSLEYRIIRANDGEVRWIKADGRVYYDNDGNPARMAGTNIDITDIKKVQLSIEKDLKRFKLLAEAIPQIVWIVDSNMNLEYINQKWMDFTGTTAETSQAWLSAVHPDDINDWETEFQNAVKENRPISIERRLRNKEGKYIWHLSRGVPVFDTAGNVVRFFGTSTNIESQKRIQHELEDINHFRERFTNTLTHDLRNPLGAVKMAAQIAKRVHNDPKQFNKYLDKIVESAERIDNMIEDLLDANRIKAGEKLHLRIEKCNLKNVAMSSLEEQSLTHGNRFHLKAIGEFDCYWSCDGLHRVFDNLLSNAVKYGTLNSPISIELKELKDDRVTVRIHNYGNELSEYEQESLFDMFKRTKKASESAVKGWGIGLTLVKGIVEAHGGTISVESGHGHGTTFVINIPRDARREGGVLE